MADDSGACAAFPAACIRNALAHATCVVSILHASLGAPSPLSAFIRFQNLNGRSYGERLLINDRRAEFFLSPRVLTTATIKFFRLDALRRSSAVNGRAF